MNIGKMHYIYYQITKKIFLKQKNENQKKVWLLLKEQIRNQRPKKGRCLVH